MTDHFDSVPIQPREAWPALALAEWQDTYATLHMWTQIVGHVRAALSPPVNHWWHVTLYVTPRGLSTSSIPSPNGIFEMEFDFLAHQLVFRTSAGAVRELALRPRTVAEFNGEVMATLAALAIPVKIHGKPDEVADPIPFAEDRVHASYDPDAAQRFWRILVSADGVFREFRSRFVGKCSPVHFFWGAFDLAVTRFSGRRAPERPGADAVQREAYSHEVSSVGFWPGGGEVSQPVFYAYFAPTPDGFAEARVRPAAAFFHQQLGEFLLPYDEVRRAASPREMLLEFCQSTYEAGAELAHWDRASLERT